MIELKRKNIRVRCTECSEENFIDMKLIGSEKEMRRMGNEIQYIFRGEVRCTHCNEELGIITTVTEYPKGIFNDANVIVQNSLIMDSIKNEQDYNIYE